MPQLGDEQVRMLLEVLCRTHDTELTCDECLPELAKLVELELAGKEPDEAMWLLTEHLAICPECVEEHDALREAIKSLGAS